MPTAILRKSHNTFEQSRFEQESKFFRADYSPAISDIAYLLISNEIVTNCLTYYQTAILNDQFLRDRHFVISRSRFLEPQNLHSCLCESLSLKES